MIKKQTINQQKSNNCVFRIQQPKKKFVWGVHYIYEVCGSPWQESRSREILEEKLLLVFPLELEKWIFMSRSPLDFQDFEKLFLFPLSVHKIFVLNFSFSSRFSRFCKTISLSPLDFQDLQKNFSSSSRFSRFCRTLSLSPLDFQDLKKSFSPLDIRDFSPFLIKIRSEVSFPHLHFPPKEKYFEWKMKSSS